MRRALTATVMCAAIVLAGCSAEEEGQAGPASSASDTSSSTAAAPSGNSTDSSSSTPDSGNTTDAGGTTTISALPVPLSVTVPEGWSSVDPAQLGVENAAWAGLQDASRAEAFATNILVEGLVVDGSTTLTALADQQFRSVGGTNVKLSKREEGGSGRAKSLTQVIRSTQTVNGRQLDIAVIQVLFGFRDVDGSGRTAVDLATFSTTADKMSTLGPDFQQFIASVRPQLG